MMNPFAEDDTPKRPIEVPAFLKDPNRPVPQAVWMILTVLVSLSLLLALRLLSVRSSPPVAANPSAKVQYNATAASAMSPRPAAAAALPAPRDFDFAALVESWREAWERRDLDDYMGHYARTFGSQDRDLEAWAAYKQSVFQNPDTIEVTVDNLSVRAGDAVVIVSFIQTYRAGSYQDRGMKKLYLVSDEGEWRIFNEEWKAMP